MNGKDRAILAEVVRLLSRGMDESWDQREGYGPLHKAVEAALAELERLRGEPQK